MPRRVLNPPLSFADDVDLCCSFVFRGDQFVSSFLTKVGDVYDCRRIIGAHSQAVPRLKVLQPFAGFQNGQGAQQPNGIQKGGITHEIGDRSDVSACPQGCDRMSDDAREVMI